MRNPLPVLAAALLAAAGAFAAELPTWQTKDEPYETWRVIEFTDAAGARHHLYCRWSECGAKVKSGTAPLYVLTRAGDEPYTASGPYHPQYAETEAGKAWEWFRGKTTKVQFQSSKTTWKSEVSRFVLDMSAKPNKAVIKGADVAIPVEPEHAAVSPTGWLFRVLPPSAVADDAPKPAPATPAKPNPARTHKPIPGQNPNPKPKTPATTQPAPRKPGAHAATRLSELERFWLIPTERTAYDDSINPAKKPTAAARQAAYKKGRETVAGNLRAELQAPYKDLVAAGSFDKIDELLLNKNYSGFETFLKPEEYAALLKVLKTADAHADFVAPNAAAQYDLEMKSILGPEGKPKANEHLLAHRTTEKFRAMLPKKPGEAVDPSAPLTDADFSGIADKTVRDALQKKYLEEWTKADKDHKAAVNADYRGQIEKLIAAARGVPTLSKLTPEERAAYDQEMKDAGNDQAKKDAVNLKYRKILARRDKDEFGRMSRDEKADLCASDKNAVIASDAAAAASACKPEEIITRTAACKRDAACLAQIKKECGNGSTAPSAQASSSVPPITDPDVKKQCFDINAGAVPPPAKGSAGGPSAIDSSPCPGAKGAKAKPGDTSKPATSDTDPCPKKPGKEDDPNFYTNMGSGISFGIGGMLLASLLGGPLLMLGVALASGIGGYYFAKSLDTPKKKDK